MSAPLVSAQSKAVTMSPLDRLSPSSRRTPGDIPLLADRPDAATTLDTTVPWVELCESSALS